MPQDDKLTIQLIIDGKTYPVTISRSQEEQYRAAAKLINEKLQRYSDSFFSDDRNDYHAMVMLDLALGSVKEQAIDEQLEQLVKKVEDALKK